MPGRSRNGTIWWLCVCWTVTTRPLACHAGQPVDGRYPMRAWESGYTIRDRVDLVLPDCLAQGQYRLTVAVYPLRLDSAQTGLKAGR